MSEWLLDEQVRKNRELRSGWDRFRHHRTLATKLVVASQPAEESAAAGGERGDEGAGAGRPSHESPSHARRLVVLGAGNCNDLDLTELASRFDEVHLVDIDAEALSAARQIQPAADWSRIRDHGGVDITGEFDRLSSWTEDHPATLADFRALAAEIRERRDSLPPSLSIEPADVVVSICLLSQLMHAVAAVPGVGHPDCLELMTAVRADHLRRMFAMLRPGGCAVLIADFVSSDTAPELLQCRSAEQLEPLVVKLIERQNFFTAMNPSVLLRLPHQEPLLKGVAAKTRVTRPWLWDLGPRLYAVCAISWIKA